MCVCAVVDKGGGRGLAQTRHCRRSFAMLNSVSPLSSSRAVYNNNIIQSTAAAARPRNYPPSSLNNLISRVYSGNQGIAVRLHYHYRCTTLQL